MTVRPKVDNTVSIDNLRENRAPLELKGKKVLFGVASSYINMGLSLLIGLISSPLYLKYLGGELFGLWATLTSIINYLNLSTNGLMITGGILWAQAYAKKETETMSRLAVTNSLVSLICATSGVAILLCLIGFDIIRPNLFGESLVVTSSTIPVLLILAMGFLVASPLDLFRGAIRGSQRVDVEQGIAGFGRLMSFLSGALVLVCGGKVITLAYASSISTIIVATMCVWWVWRNIPGLKFQLSLYTSPVARRLLSPSVHFLIISISGAVIWGTDNIVISIYLGPATVTPFALTTQLQMLATSLVAAAVGALSPTISALHSLGEVKKLRDVHLRLTKIGIATITLLTLGLVTSGGDFLRLWVGTQYVISQPILIIITIIFFIRSIAMLFEIIIVGTMRHHSYAYMCLIESILNLSLSLVLVKSIGVIGVALGTLIAHVTCTGWFIPLTAIRIARYKLSEVVSKSIFPVLPSLAFAVFCAVLCIIIIPHRGWVSLFVQAFIVGGGFWALFWRTGLCLEERELIKSALQSKIKR